MDKGAANMILKPIEHDIEEIPVGIQPSDCVKSRHCERRRSRRAAIHAHKLWRWIAAVASLPRNDGMVDFSHSLPFLSGAKLYDSSCSEQARVVFIDKDGGFIDLGSGGVGDRHVDVFWAVWTLFFNLKTDRYRERFIDAYGREKINEDMLRVVAAIEVFK
jgi:hypothetical protein